MNIRAVNHCMYVCMNITPSSFQLKSLVTWEGINSILVFTTMNLIGTADIPSLLAQLPVLKMDIYCPGDQFTSEAAVFGKWRNARHTHRHQGGWRVQKEAQVRFYYLHRTVFILIGL